MLILGGIAWLGAIGALPTYCLYVAGVMGLLSLGMHTAQVVWDVDSVWRGLLLAPLFGGAWYVIFFMMFRLVTLYWPSLLNG